MIVELALVVVLAISGYVMLLAGWSDFGWASVWLAVPTGTAVYLVVALISLTAMGTFDPTAALVVTSAVGLIGLVITTVRDGVESGVLIQAAAVVALVLVTVAVARTVHLTRLTPDSLRYLLFAADMQLPEALNEVSRRDLLNRQVGLPSLHALSSLTDRRYLTSIGPLFGISGLGFIVWLCWNAAREMAQPRRLLLVGSAALFLASSNRLVYDVFYINTHIQVAFYLLVAIAGAWLAVTTRGWAWAVPAGVALAATLLFRPEAPIIAAIVLVAVGASEAGWRVRLAIAVPTAVVAALWYGVVLWQNAIGGDTISLSAPVFGSLVALAAAVGVLVAGSFSRLFRVVRYADGLMLVFLTLALVGLAAMNVEIFRESLEATFQNVVLSQGAWLFTWTAGLVLLIVALLVQEVPVAKLWITPIVGFALVWWILPILRDSAWRAGTGDSGNRILAHILPVVVAFLVLAAIRPWGWARTEGDVLDQPAGVPPGRGVET